MWRMLLLVGWTLLLSTIALAQEDGGAVLDGGVVASIALPPGATDDPGFVVRLLVHAVRERNWALLSAALLLVLVWVLRARLKQLPKHIVPVVSLALAAIPGTVVVLLRPDVSWEEALTATVGIWLMAAGGWSGMVKIGMEVFEEKKEVRRRRRKAAPPESGVPAPVPTPEKH